MGSKEATAWYGWSLVARGRVTGTDRRGSLTAATSGSRQIRDRLAASRLRPAVVGWVERARGSLELAQELSNLPFQGSQSSQDGLLIPEQLLAGGGGRLPWTLAATAAFFRPGEDGRFFDGDAVKDFVVAGRFAAAACVVLAAW